VLAFPVRSAKGAFAWITCPLVLARYKRDADLNYDIPEIKNEDECLSSDEAVQLSGNVILEEYKFKVNGETDIWTHLKDAVDDEVWQDIGSRFVIVSDEIFSYFVEHACEVVSRICIDDETGVTKNGALFNQEQVPSETMFYAVVGEQKSVGSLDKLSAKLAEKNNIIQVGANETIGLGYCSVSLNTSVI
jgi:CRISPR-associated protein Cmr4